MIYEKIKDFVKVLPPRGAILGIDWGEKRAGIAITDPNRKFAFARPISKNEHISHITYYISQEKVCGIVLGLPLYFDGSESETTARVRNFAAELTAALPDVPIFLSDETLSSAEAGERTGRATGLDSEAARVILEDFLSVNSK